MHIAEVRFKVSDHLTFIFTTNNFETKADAEKQAKAHFAAEMPDTMEHWKKENIEINIKED